MRKVDASMAFQNDATLTEIERFCKGEISKDVLAFIECLNTPLSLYNHEENRFVYANKPFIALSGHTKESLLTTNQPYFGLWIQDEDYDILKNKIWEELKILYDKTIHFSDERLSYMINFRMNEKKEEHMFRHMLVQTNVLSWKETNKPEVTLDLYSDIDHRKHSNKILLTVNHLSKIDAGWKMVLEKEFVRVPKMLANREKEILVCIIKDRSATEIARHKGISVHTVRAHWRNILRKTNCSSQKELKSYAYEQGWI